LSCAKIAIIGGSSLNDLEQLSSSSPVSSETKYGQASSGIRSGQFAGKQVVFVARHGADYQTPPHLINYRANIQRLKELGVEKILAVNTVGGINSKMPAGCIVIPDQLIDYSWGRHSTYSEQGNVIFIEFEKPFDSQLRTTLLDSAVQADLDCIDFGVYGCTQGPRLETAAEINRLERDGCDLVGMTAMPEAALARELGIAYASICLVVNPAAGRSEQPISMAQVEKIASVGMVKVVQLLEHAVSAIV